MQKTFTIGDLARYAAVPVETIRYYEHERLLRKPARTHGNYRLYLEADRERLSFIRYCRSLAMTLDEIRQLLRLQDAPDDTCETVNVMLDAHIDQVAIRIGDLRRLKRQLQALRDRCGLARTAKNCGILSGLNAAATLPQPSANGGDRAASTAARSKAGKPRNLRWKSSPRQVRV